MVPGLLNVIAVAFVAADAVDVRPELVAVVSSFEESGYDCSETSPSGYIQWCAKVLYPRPSVRVGLGCDGTHVDAVSLDVVSVGDSSIVEVPEVLRMAIDDPTLQLPGDAAVWLEACVAATGSEVVPPDPLVLDRIVMKCAGTRTAPAVRFAYLTQDGKRYADGSTCQRR